jgi:hypothetical protein
MTCMVTPLTVFVMIGTKIRYVLLKIYFYKMVEPVYGGYQFFTNGIL